MTFADRLSELRKEFNMTQKELADILGVSRGTIGMYEIGQRDPDTETIIKIARIFNVTSDYLMGLSNNRKQSNQKEDEKLKTLEDYIEQAETLMLYGQVMDEKDKEALLTAIKVAYETAIKKKKTKEQGKNKEE